MNLFFGILTCSVAQLLSDSSESIDLALIMYESFSDHECDNSILVPDEYGPCQPLLESSPQSTKKEIISLSESVPPIIYVYVSPAFPLFVPDIDGVFGGSFTSSP